MARNSIANKRNTGKSKAAKANPGRVPKIEVQAKIDLMHVVDEVGTVGELIETSNYLLKGILQNMGVHNETIATSVAIVALLEKAERMQEQLHDDAHALLNRLSDAGVTVTRQEAHHE